jgi:hypothetical protein
MSNWPAILLLILVAGCAGRASLPAPPSPVATPDPIQDQAAEFRDLRATPGHFQGGDWNNEVDRWMGRKHALMIELGERMDTGTYSRAQAVDLLGAPDAVARKGDPLYDQIRDRAEFKGPSGSEYAFLIYHWRGEHDVLYLVARDQAILSSGWWYAGD